METPNPEDLDIILKDFSSVFPGTRKYAAQSLGQLTTSSAEVVQALAVVVAIDSDPEVRTATVLALQAPVHQEFIKKNPALMEQAVESAIRGRQQEQQAADLEITGEFQRRLSLEKRAYLVFFLTIFGLFGAFILLVALEVGFKTLEFILRIVQLGVIGSAVFFFWRSYRKWLCPNCDGWLGGFKAGINVFFASPPLKRPHCGARLM